MFVSIYIVLIYFMPISFNNRWSGRKNYMNLSTILSYLLRVQPDRFIYDLTTKFESLSFVSSIVDKN